MKVKFIVNPKFGEEPTNIKIKTIKECFKNHDISFYITKDRKSTIEEVSASKGFDIIVSVGGDGTLNEVVNGVMKLRKKPIIGIVPYGTSNVFATELNIPIDTREACKKILQKKPRKIDIGVVNDKYYFVMWSTIGLDALISKHVDENNEDKKTLGRIAFFLYGALDVFNYYNPTRLSVKLDTGYKGKGNYIIVANGSHYAGDYLLNPNSSIDDGYFDILLLKGNNPLSIIKYVFGVISGAHRSFRDITRKRAKSVEVSFLRPVWMHIDGEPFKITEYKAKIIPKALEFL